MADYKIQLGVDVDVSDIQSQINTKAKDVSIPIKLEVENIGDIKKQIQGLGVSKDGIEIPLSIDTSATIKSAQQVGQKIGTAITKNVKQSINIDDIIDKEVLSLMKTFSIAGDKGSDAFKEIRQALIECRNELQKLKNSDIGIDAEVFDTSRAFDKVSDAIANQMRAVNNLGDEYIKLAKYMANFNDPKKGNKVRVPDFIKQEQGDDYKSSRGTLGIAFNTEKGISFASFIEDLNHELGIAIDLTKGEEKAYEELLHKVRLGREQLKESKKSENSLQATASTDEILSQNYINKNEIRDIAESSIDYINATEAASANLSADIASDFKEANIEIGQTEDKLESLRTALKSLGISDASIENIVKDFEKLDVTVKKVTGRLNDNGSMKLSIKGINNDGDVVTQTTNIKADNTIGSWSKSVTKELSEAEQKFERLKTVTREINGIKLDLFKFEDSGNIERATNQLNELENEATELRATLQQKYNITSFDEIDNIVKQGKESIDSLIAKTEEAKNKLANGIRFNIETEKFENQIDEMTAKFNRLSEANDDLRNSYEATKNAYKAMTDAADANTGDELADRERLIQAEKEYVKALEKTNNLIKQQARKDKIDNDAIKLEDNRAIFQSKIDAWIEKNSAATKRFGAQLLDLRTKAEKADQVELNHLEKELTKIDKAADKAGLKMQNFSDRVSTKLKEYMAYISVAEVFMYAEQALSSMFEQVKLIDSAMTELKKVTDETDASYDRFLTNAASRAKEIGTTIDGLVSSTADFARLGYDFADAQGLAEVANIYAVVGDDIEGVEGATQSLISTMAAFKDEMSGLSNTDFAMSIIDKLNEVANNYSISSGGLGEALQRSASSLEAGNNTLDESISLITAANEVVQNPEKVGNAMKTISMRIRSAKSEMEEMGENTDGMVESTATLRAEIKALSGVDIMASATEFKSTYQILDELSQKWEGLSDIAQATIIEKMAGKHQGNVFSSLMENFDTARNALETSLNSAGSALKEHEKWQQSLEAQILSLSASWQGLSQAFLSSDFLKVVLDGVIGLVDGLTKLIDTFGALPTLLGIFTGLKTAFTIFKTGGFSGIKGFGDILAALKESFPLISLGASKLSTSFKGLISSSGGAKGAIAKLFGVLASHPYITAAVIAVTALTTAFTYQKKKAEELAEAVEETVGSYKEQHNELIKLKSDYDTSNESSMISKYAKLSKGVDGLGKNISLTADEYSEYQNIVSSIAEQIPSLVSGYDDQGNAILSCKGNVEELTNAYQKLIHEQNRVILTSTGDIEKDFANTLKDASGKGIWSNNHGFWSGILNMVGLHGLSNLELKDDTVKGIQNLLDAKNEAEKNAIINSLSQDRYAVEEIRDALTSAGIDVGTFESPIDVLSKQLKKDPQKIKNIIDDYYSQFNDAVAEQKTIAQAKLSEAFDVSSAISGLDYGNINEKLQDIAKQTVNSLDYDFFSNLQEQGKTVEQWTTELLNQLNSIGKADNAQIEAAFDLQTKFNGGDISYGKYIESLRDVESTIDGLNLKGEAKEQLKISLGLDDSGIVDQYDALIKRLTSKEIGLNDKAAKNFLNSLSAEELDVLVDIIPNLDAGTTINEIQSLIDEKLATEFTFDIELQTTGIEAFNTALSEARSAAGLTSESIAALQGRYKDLDGFNAGALFERTANGVRVNNEELARLEAQYENVNKLDIDKNLSKLVKKYQDLTEKIKTCTDTQEKESLQLQADAYANKIQELQTLAAQYDGLTSSFSKWQQAQASPNDGDNYDSVFESLEALQESYKAGLVGTDDFRAAVQLMSNEDLSTASVDKLVSVYKEGLPKMKRYFTEGQKGCKNFLNDVNKLNSEWAHLNEKGEWEINIDVEEAAEKLNMDVSTIYLILDKLKDYGFEINIDDTSLKNIQTDIEKTEARLKELGRTPQPINLDASDIKTIDGEISKLKTHISEVKNDNSLSVEVKTAELDDARTKLEALIQKKQEASQPAFMNLDASQVKSSMVEALSYVQDYQNSIENINMLFELQEYGIEVDDSELDTAKQKVDEYAKLIQGLPDEVKLAIGLKEDASIDDIKSAFANGDIVIDADTSTTNVKIEKLAENIERIEDKDVTITVTIDGLEDVKELNRQIDLATNIDGDIDKLSEYVKGAKALSDLDSNIVTNVTANITGNVKDTPEFSINNLETFAKCAKELKGVGTFSSKVTADIAGNVKDTPEFSINNLKVFSESAKGIEDIGDVKSKVTADIAGNVKDTPEYMINNLKAFTENAKDIDGIGEDVKAKITADIAGNVKDTPEFSINNLKVFTENAKDIENIGEDVKAKITADIEGNVKDTPEFAINNLKVFTDNAKDIEETGNVGSEVTANVKGNVVDTYEYQLDNLKKYTDSAKDIEKTGDVESKVTANVDGNVVDTFEYQLDNLKVFTDNAKDVKNIGNVESSVTANIKGNVTDTFEYKIDNLKSYSDNAADVEKIGSVKSDVEANVSGNVIDEFEYKLNNLKVFSDSAKDVKDIGTVESKVTANIDGNVIDEFEYKINNIEVFAEGAKTLKGIGNVESKVEANIDGNVIDEFEYKINNLKVFSDNVKDIKGIGNVESKVTADVGGNVIDTKEYKIDNLKAYTDSAKDVESIGNVTSKVTADVSGNVIDTKEYKIDNLKVYTDSAKKVESIGTVKSSVKADVSGNVIDTKEYKLDNLKVFGESAKKTKDIGTVTSNVTANVNGNVINTTEEKIDNLGVFANNANKLKNTGNFTSSVTATVGGNIITDDTAVTDLEHFASVVSGMTNQTVTVSVTANVDSANINSAISLLSGLNDSGIFKDYSATVQVGAKIAKIDDTTIKNYKAPPKEGKVKYLVDSSKVDAWKAPPKKGVVNYSAKVDALTDAQKHKTGTITYKANIVGLGPAAGTAHAIGSAKENGSSGRAFARGDWGIKGNGVALGGELGPEIVVRQGKFFTIGDEGAEFFRYKKNDIVFNATQTEALLKYGGLKGANPRGKMLATGTAFAEGNAFATASGGGKFYNSSTGQSYGSKSSDSDSSSDKDFEEVIDWIEVIIDRVERSIDKFDQQANNIYKSWSSRNSALQSEISEVSREINLQQQSYSRYMSAAAGVGLSSSWQNKVKNGTIDISTIKDEALAEKISSYKEWYEKALDCKDAIRELQEQESKLYAQRFENIQTQYDGILQGYEHTEAMLNEYVSQAEEQGYIVSKKYYEALVTNEKQNINALKQEQAELIKTRDEAVASGKITKNSEAWLEQCAAIDEITQAIEESTTALLEFDNAMREIDWSVFDLIQERISGITEESDFLIELMSNKDLFDDNGKFTSQGLATLGLHAQNVNTHMYAADTYGEEVAKLDAQIKNDPYDQELINRRNELLELQRESILAAEQEKDAIKDLVENGIEEQLNSLKELIDKKNEALESERDLYEYQKKVAEQSKEVASLEKQLAAYSGDDSEEAKQKIQQIKVDLESARQDLQETEMDKVLEDTSALLDNLFLEAETLLNSRLDNVDALLESVIETINIAASADGNIVTALGSEGAIALSVSNNAASIKDTLASETNKVGITLSNAMNSIWNSGDGNAKSVLTMYGEDFKSKSAIIITTLNSIKSSVNSMVSSSNKEAATKTTANKTTTSAKKNPTTSSSSKKTTTTTKKSSSGDGTPKIGDRVKYVSGQYYYDSQGSKPLGSHNKGEYVYITNINTRDWATHGYHISTGNKLGKGDLGWLKLNQLSGYASGKEKFYDDENAWTQEDGREFIVRPSDGAILTPIAKGDSVLNATASGNIWNMANSPAEFIKENLKLGASSVPNTSSVNNSIVQNFENITFSMPNVHGYNELLSEMQRDPKFEKFILSMTIDQIAGRSKLAKGKSIR